MALLQKFITFFVSSGLVALAVAADSSTRYSIESQKSKIEIQVAREGFFKAFGHDHLLSAPQFSGEIRLDQAKLEESSVNLTIDAKSLTVVDPGESEKDRKEVQNTMLGEQVLDVARYPQIRFSSSSVKVTSGKKDLYQLQVGGTLSLHGTKKPCSLPVRLQIEQDNTLSAYAEVSLLQTDFGITPIKVAGGTVRVKDKLKLAFHILASKASAEPAK
ncbi:MAG TPA: YceI family protein [Candidatus Acidoferrum sp.]|nr:YceI family protein [Candidatus Acidoferrum sp.]